MKIKNVILNGLRRHQTRQQLKYIPEHIFKDIARTPAEVNREINKRSITSLILTGLRRLQRLQRLHRGG